MIEIQKLFEKMHSHTSMSFSRSTSGAYLHRETGIAFASFCSGYLAATNELTIHLPVRRANNDESERDIMRTIGFNACLTRVVMVLESHGIKVVTDKDYG
jgi:hypothetical protein